MAGARYSASGNQTLTTTFTTALTVGSNATTAHRNYITSFLFGNEGTPADLVSVWTAQRVTALGTATLVTATKRDMADRVAQAACGENHTVEPTYTAAEEAHEPPINHRGTYRWMAMPGDEIVTPATVGAGIGFKALHASAVTDFRAEAAWLE